jgi:hypothetical protein
MQAESSAEATATYEGGRFKLFCASTLTMSSLSISFSRWEPGSSVSIVSGYGLDDRKIGVRSPAGTKDFSSSLCLQTGSGAHPASCPLGTDDPFWG